MLHNKFKKNSIQLKLILPMLVIIVLQAVLSAVFLVGLGTINDINHHSKDVLSTRINQIKSQLESDMLFRWSSLDLSVASINKSAQSIAVQKSSSITDALNNKEIVQELLTESNAALMDLLQQTNVTGAFLILDTSTVSSGTTLDAPVSRSAIYLRDLNPTSTAANNSDIMAEAGPVDIMRSLGIAMDTAWTYELDFSRDQEYLTKNNMSYDYFFKPMEAARQYPGASYENYAYWSKPFSIAPNGIRVITYSVPLIDKHRKPYGVLGVEISLDYIKEILPYNLVSEEKDAAYIIGSTDSESLTYTGLITNGILIKPYLSESSAASVTLSPFKRLSGLYEFQSPEMEDMLAFISPVPLYNANTPFVNERWALIGVVPKSMIFGISDQVLYSAILSLFISLLLGVFGVIVMGRRFSKPVAELATRVRNLDPDKPIVLEKTNISELDELSKSIIFLSASVAKSASKMSMIIDLVGLPIGAFEYNIDSEYVFITNSLFRIFDISPTAENSMYISFKDFKICLGRFTEHPEESIPGTFQVTANDGQMKWYKIRANNDEERILGVVVDVTDEILQKQQVERERDIDKLTGLLNRNAFHRAVSHQLSAKNDFFGALMLWDLDNLKYVNDTYGHDTGDQYIKRAAKLLDLFSEKNGIVARMSGDEFNIFLYGYKHINDLRDIINEVKKIFDSEQFVLPNGTMLRLRASAGIAYYPDDSRNLDELIRYADFAMYEVKHTVKGVLREFNSETYHRDSFLFNKQEYFNILIDNQMVDFAFQPIVNARTGAVHAYEALMRSTLPTISSPMEILRLAHTHSKLGEIEHLTFFNSMAKFREKQETFGDTKIFVNSIGNQCLSDNEWSMFEREYGEYLNRIVLEITENEQTNERCTITKLGAIKRWGAQLAIDDYGAGYSNDLVLLKISPNYIKIDMSIVKGIHQDIDRQKLITNIISYATERNIKTIAEGVETVEELEILIKFGIDFIQGYYVGMPSFTPLKIEPDIVNKIEMFYQKYYGK